MTNLELLTLFLLAQIKPLRESVNPDELGSIAPLAEQMKADATATLKTLLKSEFGIVWDGAQRVGDCVLEETKRIIAIERAKKEIDRKIIALDAARRRLDYRNIAGNEAVDASIETVNQCHVESTEVTVAQNCANPEKP